MSDTPKKYFVVWVGKTPGIFENWEECKASIHKFKGAKYKSFPTLESAQRAYNGGIPKNTNRNKGRFYVVWKGVKTGVFNNWTDCKIQIENFKNAKYKSFNSEKDAKQAFKDGADKHLISLQSKETNTDKPILKSICVDAACSANPGPVEYRGVHTSSKRILFSIGPLEDGTNNIGEFLAIVHALSLCKKHNRKDPIYSDSMTAIFWVKNKKANTTLVQTEKNLKIFQMISRAEKWLEENNYENPIIKWETKKWGQIFADYNRK